ncbi:MAG: aldo/keto reductase [Bacteroidales bacterium]
MKNKKENRREFFKKATASAVGLVVAPNLINADSKKANEDIKNREIEPIWRNRSENMQYRMLGRTGMMVSEITLGTLPLRTPDHFPIFDTSIERGINYFDTAYAYGRTEVESNLGAYFKQTGNREKIFLATKMSPYFTVVDNYIEDIFKGLPASKQEAIHKKASDMIAERTVKRSGYHMNYFSRQESQFDRGYFRHVMLQEYGYKKGLKEKIKKSAHNLLEESLSRLQTDYVDVLHIPHGIAVPEQMDDTIKELFEEFKQKGLVRASAVSFHNDVAANLINAINVGFYDVTMFAYNIAIHAALEAPLYNAKQSGMGLIAMKLVNLFTRDSNPSWILDKLNTAIPDENMSKFSKSYVWALQNPNLTCCVSQMENLDELTDNLTAIGKKVDIENNFVS